MTKICIVSPHLDDAVLSCGVMMQRHAATGEVLTLNVFSAGTNSENRKKEDLLAQKVVRAQPFFLDELDAPDRDARFHSLKERFFYPLTPVDESLITKITRRIDDFLVKNKIDTAYFPLGAGGHVDHRICFEAGRRIKSATVKFYEDRPYALWPGILKGRLNQIGADVVLPDVSGNMMTETASAFYYLRDFMPEGSCRDENLPLYIAALSHANARTVAAKHESLPPATTAEMQKTYTSLILYESWMSLIYKDFGSFVAESFAYEHHMSGNNAYVERYWMLGTP